MVNLLPPSQKANDQIETITTSTAMESTGYIAGIPLGLSLLSCLGLTVLVFCDRNHGTTEVNIRNNHHCRHCRHSCTPPQGGETGVDSPSTKDAGQRLHELNLKLSEGGG